MARKKLPPELKAKNHTFKLYDWEVEKVKEYIKCVRASKKFYILDAFLDNRIKGVKNE